MQKAALRGRGALADSWNVTDASHPLNALQTFWGQPDSSGGDQDPASWGCGARGFFRITLVVPMGKLRCRGVCLAHSACPLVWWPDQTQCPRVSES